MADPGPLSPLLDVLKDLAAWLEGQGVRGAVIGGVAASLHGRPRTTRDVDAVVWLGIVDLKEFLEAGARVGFSERVSDAIGFAARSRVLLLTHVKSRTPVDISLGALPFEEECISRASMMSVAGVSFPVVSPEDLIIMKAVAHRPRDIADIESVLDANPNLDTKRVRVCVREFASLLETPEILDDLDKVIAKARKI